MTTCLQCGHADPGEFLFCPRCGTKAVESAGGADPLLGRILNGKYRVESQIGQGAMGTVYLGEHIGLKKKVALKVLHPDLQVSDESLQRFQREGIAAGKFSHPHLIQIFDFDRSDGRVFYLAMEYVDGVNLALFLRQRGRLPVEIAVKLARQILSCLAEAHRHGIVHRDLKPDNVMVSEGSRGELRVKVLDFGLSKLVDRRLDSSLVTQPGRLLGTPLYMAPEQAAGEEADERSDVYAAGLILYEMLAGERPFEERGAAQLFLTRPTAEAPSLRARVPDLAVSDELDALLLRALQRDRDARFQTAEEMLSALDDVPFDAPHPQRSGVGGAGRSRTYSSMTGPSVARGVVGPAAGERRGPRVPRRWIGAAAVLVLALVVGLGYLVRGTEAAPARVRLVPVGERSEEERRYVGLLDEARAALLRSDPQAALTSINQAFLLDCRDAEAFLVRGEVYRARGDEDTALADFEAAAQGDPRYAAPLLGKGWIGFARGDLESAAASFARAAEIAPDDADVLAARGALAWRRGEAEAARTLLERAIERDPASAAAHLYLGRLALDAGDPSGAVAALVEAKRNDPFSLDALLWLAEAYLASGRTDQADVQLEEALRLAPRSAEVRLQRAALLLERGRAGDALEFLAESTERVPQDGRLWVLRGVAAAESGDTASAVDALRRGLDQGARDPDARCLLGLLYQRNGRVADARAQYEAVLREVGDYPRANLGLGITLFAEGEYGKAAERLQRVLDFDEENADAHFWLGVLRKDYLEDEALAIAHLERYLALGGGDPRAEEWLDELR